MSKLQKLYNSIKDLQECGVAINKEQMQAVDAAEEDIIRDEVLPVIVKNIDPQLSPIQRPLILIVEHQPGQPVSVKISRKVNASNMLQAKVIQLDPVPIHKSGTSKVYNGRGKVTLLRVTFPDGTVIYEKQAKQTLVNSIVKIGVTTVRGLNLKMSNALLVSNTVDPRYKSEQTSVGGGWYIMTHSNTEQKKRTLEKISKQLGLGLKVEII